MNPVETADFYGGLALAGVDAGQRAALGQYLTPPPLARFIASLLSCRSEAMRALDPGAGAGALTAALAERIAAAPVKPARLSLVCPEISPALRDGLRHTLPAAQLLLESAGIPAAGSILADDFIAGGNCGDGFTHILMNPPYRKIRADSEQRRALRRAGLETSNLYAGFMFLAALRLRPGGEMAAIVPRSFCNGPYFKPFRQQFFALMGLRRIHLFQRRNALFSNGGVLQENIIIHAVKAAQPERVKVTTSDAAGPELLSKPGSAPGWTEQTLPYAAIIHPDDPELFLHIPSPDCAGEMAALQSRLPATLPDLGLTVSTGPVVDFRCRDYLSAQPAAGTAPLLYPAHFSPGGLDWPRLMKKPNAIQVTTATRRWLWANRGCFVTTRRFSAKEERRRIVAAVYAGNLPGPLVGFENHLNVFHARQQGFAPELAAGLSVYLNSSFVDRCFRQFNGHTQVNAADLRALPYPEPAALTRIGRQTGGGILSQPETDALMARELGI